MVDISSTSQEVQANATANVAHQAGHEQAEDTTSGAEDTTTGSSAAIVKGKTRSKKLKRLVIDGIVHINATFNNTIITITDMQGDVISWATAASSGYRGSRKSTPHAAVEAAQAAGRKAIDHFGLKRVEVRVSGPGQGPRCCNSCIIFTIFASNGY